MIYLLLSLLRNYNMIDQFTEKKEKKRKEKGRHTLLALVEEQTLLP